MIRYYSGNLVFPKNGGLKNLQEIFRTKKLEVLQDGRCATLSGSGRQSTLRVPDNISTIENLVLSQNNVFINKKLMLIK